MFEFQVCVDRGLIEDQTSIFMSLVPLTLARKEGEVQMNVQGMITKGTDITVRSF